MPLSVRRCFGDVDRCGDRNAINLPNGIRFFHPGYGKTPISANDTPPNRDSLIALPALDDGGIHYDTAHTACGILTGNRWDGYFSLVRDGSVRVQPPADGILRESAYFFCLPPSSDPSADPYPVVAGFRDWRFPHRNLPLCWERLRPRFLGTAQGTARRCIMTDCGFSLDNAHLVPVKQSRWYIDNDMMTYGRALSFSTAAVNAPMNSITLRTDVHRMFDERNFCFVPKLAPPDERALALRTPTVSMDNSGSENIGTEQNQYRAHDEASRIEQQSSAESATTSRPQDVLVGHVFTSAPGGELQKLWHNREAHPGLYAASLESLFARFAWTVFSPSIFCAFLLATTEPRLLLVSDEHSGQYISEWRDPEKCKLTLRAAQARSESPTKRQRPASDAGRDEDYWRDGEPREYQDSSLDIDSSYPDEPYQYYGGDLDNPSSEEEERGRPRKRKHMDSDSVAFEDNEYSEYRRAKRAPV